MTDSLQWTDIHRELKEIYSFLDREQARLFTRSMSIKNKAHEIKELIETVKSTMEQENNENYEAWREEEALEQEKRKMDGR